MPSDFERALTETITNVRRGPPVPARRDPPASARRDRPRRAGEDQARPEESSRAPARKADDGDDDIGGVVGAILDRGQEINDAGRVLVDEVTLGILPFVRAAVESAVSGEDADFEGIRRELQREVEAAKQRLGEGATTALELGSMVLPGGVGAKVARRGREVVGGLTGGALGGAVRGATDDIEEPTLSGRRLGDAVQGAAIEAGTGAVTGAALKGGRIVGEQVSDAVRRRRQSGKRQGNAALRRRGEELTRRPDEDAARDLLERQPQAFTIEVFRGIGNNQTIGQIASRLGVSQDDVARTILRNRDKVIRTTPGDRRLKEVEIAGQQGTIDARNFNRLVREAREVVDTVDRFRELPASRGRTPARSRAARQGSETDTQGRQRQERVTADPAEQGRREALQDQRGGAQDRDVSPDQASPALEPTRRRTPEPALDNSVRARLAVQAMGRRPARTKLENIQIGLSRLGEISDDDLPAVAEALGIDPSRSRLRALVRNALEALRPPGVSAFTGASLGAAATRQEGEE